MAGFWNPGHRSFGGSLLLIDRHARALLLHTSYHSSTARLPAATRIGSASSFLHSSMSAHFSNKNTLASLTLLVASLTWLTKSILRINNTTRPTNYNSSYSFSHVLHRRRQNPRAIVQQERPTTKPRKMVEFPPTPEVKAALEELVRDLWAFIRSDVYRNECQRTTPANGTTYDMAGPDEFLYNLTYQISQKNSMKKKILSQNSADILTVYVMDRLANGESTAAKKRYDATGEQLPKPEDLDEWIPTTKHGYWLKFNSIKVGDGRRSYDYAFPVVETKQYSEFKPFVIPVVVNGVTLNILLEKGKLHGIRELLHPILCYYFKRGAQSHIKLRNALRPLISCSAELVVKCFLVNRDNGGYINAAIAAAAAAPATPSATPSAATAPPPGNTEVLTQVAGLSAQMTDLSLKVDDLGKATNNNTKAISDQASATNKSNAQVADLATATKANTNELAELSVKVNDVAKVTEKNTAAISDLSLKVDDVATATKANTNELAQVSLKLDDVATA